MNTYQRIFGTGPRGLLASIMLLIVAACLKDFLGLSAILASPILRLGIFGLSILLTAVLVIWSLKSLPASSRGRQLTTSGAFKYFRHPLYAAFLLFFDFGLVVYLNNWIFVLWAILLHPLWHLNVRGEEKLMQAQFPESYNRYCASTGRFFPRLIGVGDGWK